MICQTNSHSLLAFIIKKSSTLRVVRGLSTDGSSAPKERVPGGKLWLSDVSDVDGVADVSDVDGVADVPDVKGALDVSDVGTRVSLAPILRWNTRLTSSATLRYLHEDHNMSSAKFSTITL